MLSAKNYAPNNLIYNILQEKFNDVVFRMVFGEKKKPRCRGARCYIVAVIYFTSSNSASVTFSLPPAFV